jgi:hypothetical protein
VVGADGARLEGFRGAADLLVNDSDFLRDRSPGGVPIEPYWQYRLAGPAIFRGSFPVQDGRFEARIRVPLSIVGGPRGRIRAYVEPEVPGPFGADATAGAGAIDTLRAGGTVPARSDTTPPEITVVFPNASVAVTPGSILTIVLRDTSGIDLTERFEFRSILVSLADGGGLEKHRVNATSAFRYDSGSHTRGSIPFAVPALPPGSYVLRVDASDGFNNRGTETVDLEIVESADLRVSEFQNWPNPFEKETAFRFRVTEPVRYSLAIRSTAGRAVRTLSGEATTGENVVPWDGRDAAGDRIANGVYLVKLEAKGLVSGRSVEVWEKAVRLE